jgi:hypothetical protein
MSTALLLGGCAMTPSTASTASTERTAAATHEGAIELEWQAPKDRINGAPLSASDIAGYRIYVGEQPGQPKRVVEVNGAQQTHQLLRGLKTGEKYYIAISTVDRHGQESPRTEEIRLAAEPVTAEQIAKAEQRQGQSQRASLD